MSAFHIPSAAALLTASLLAGQVAADEATLRKNLAERLKNLPKIDEVTKTPVPGLWEVRIGNELFYSDDAGDHLIQGSIIDTRTRSDLTQERIDKLTAIAFGSLPLNDAIVWKQGSGERKLAVFADPNCGYCKRFERDLVNVKDVTVYTFLYPILGGDSPDKARDIWCAKDATKVWRDWMVESKPPPKTAGQCDTSALKRVAELARKHRVTGTPALVFENGTRVPGALPAEQVEKRLAAARDKS